MLEAGYNLKHNKEIPQQFWESLYPHVRAMSRNTRGTTTIQGQGLPIPFRATPQRRKGQGNAAARPTVWQQFADCLSDAANAPKLTKLALPELHAPTVEKWDHLTLWLAAAEP